MTFFKNGNIQIKPRTYSDKRFIRRTVIGSCGTHITEQFVAYARYVKKDFTVLVFGDITLCQDRSDKGVKALGQVSPRTNRRK
ncbi:hypothetical protein FACS1894211_02370 [Clostridia bacterium]|nr:hypothetical protein FACS1894211_02370 [Clostridia bacterium]